MYPTGLLAVKHLEGLTVDEKNTGRCKCKVDTSDLSQLVNVANLLRQMIYSSQKLFKIVLINGYIVRGEYLFFFFLSLSSAKRHRFAHLIAKWKNTCPEAKLVIGGHNQGAQVRAWRRFFPS